MINIVNILHLSIGGLNINIDAVFIWINKMNGLYL